MSHSDRFLETKDRARLLEFYMAAEMQVAGENWYLELGLSVVHAISGWQLEQTVPCHPDVNWWQPEQKVNHGHREKESGRESRQGEMPGPEDHWVSSPTTIKRPWGDAHMHGSEKTIVISYYIDARCISIIYIMHGRLTFHTYIYDMYMLRVLYPARPLANIEKTGIQIRNSKL